MKIFLDFFLKFSTSSQGIFLGPCSPDMLTISSAMVATSFIQSIHASPAGFISFFFSRFRLKVSPS